MVDIKPGTAFFVSAPLDIPDHHDCYLITAKHVIEGIKEKSIDQKVYVRMNLKSAPAKFVQAPIEKWLFHPEEANVDVAIFNWIPQQDIYDYRIVPINMAATEDVIKREEIGVGDDVFLTGLFVNHYGLERNIPIIRVGNIASMPEEKVRTEKLGDIDAYLVEARSIGGLSGSPVFAYLGAMRRIGNKVQMGRQGPLFYWLGLMHGHFDRSKLELDNLVEDSLINLKINMGIAIVVPVWKVIEVINQEIFMKRREEASKAVRK
ncbi:MAG: trypsin-like peptidase domain-containing protein [Dehalococcoidales bacterium]|nr:trypsin-like peptidase domain-containing protein [Dehalococcoidales bacterium]